MSAKREKLLMGEVRHHLVTIAAWHDLPDRAVAMEAELRIAVRECVRALLIAPSEIERRKAQLGIRREDR